jgi:hypothetical protein
MPRKGLANRPQTEWHMCEVTLPGLHLIKVCEVGAVASTTSAEIYLWIHAGKEVLFVCGIMVED